MTKRKRVMTPNELYNRIPENSHYELECLNDFYYSHVPEVGDWSLGDANEKEQRVLIKEYKFFDFDGRRFWRLASVWFDNTKDDKLADAYKPVMIIQNAGREGDDHASRFITNESLYMEMVSHIRSLINTKYDEMYDVVDPDVDINNLTSFYGNELDGHFERYRL